MKTHGTRVLAPAENHKAPWPSFVHPTVASHLQNLDADIAVPPHEGVFFEVYDRAYNGGGDVFFCVYNDRVECEVLWPTKRSIRRRKFVANHLPLDAVYQKAQTLLP